MITYKVTYDVTIPVYDGTTNGQVDFLRPTTFKGILRFWWRALIFGRFHNLLKDNDAALGAMKRCENHLFGSSDQKIGQARLKIGSLISIESAHKDNKIHKKPGIDYFAGQGMRDDRPLSVSRFEITLRLKDDRPNVEEIKAEDWILALETVDDALVVLGLIGGLGKKSRKGFGSLSIQEMTKNDGPVDCDISDDKKYKELLTKHLGSSQHYMPEKPFEAPFTCINGHMSIHIVTKNSDPTNCLQQMGWAYKYHRSNGTTQKHNNVDKDKREVRFGNEFMTTKEIKIGLNNSCQHWDDHDWMEDVLDLAENYKGDNTNISEKFYFDFPNRFAFGLPHNYLSTSKRGYNSISVTCENDRRASPLFFHVQKTENSNFGIITVIPATFPKDINIKISKKGGNDTLTATIPLSAVIFKNMQATYGIFLEGFNKVPHLEARLYFKNKHTTARQELNIKDGNGVMEGVYPIPIIPGKETGETPDEQDIHHD